MSVMPLDMGKGAIQPYIAWKDLYLRMYVLVFASLGCVWKAVNQALESFVWLYHTRKSNKVSWIISLLYADRWGFCFPNLYKQSPFHSK